MDVRTLMDWNHCVNTYKPAIEEALSQGERIALSPGGIAEMFEWYVHKYDCYVSDLIVIFVILLFYHCLFMIVLCAGGWVWSSRC